MRVISNTRCTVSGPAHEREPAARLARPHVGEHDRAQPAGVHELESAQVEHHGAEVGIGGQALELGLERGGAGEVELAGRRDRPRRSRSWWSRSRAWARRCGSLDRPAAGKTAMGESTAPIGLLRPRNHAPSARQGFRVPATRRATGSTSRRCSSASASWGSRRRGRTSGSARIRSGTCRPRASTRPAASSTSTTRAGARGATPRSSTTWCGSPARCRSCASACEDDLDGRRAHARRACWRARSGCWTAASSASAPRSTPVRTRPTASRRCASST